MNKTEFLNQRYDKVGLLMKSENNIINVYIEGIDDYNFYRKFFPSANIVKCGKKSIVIGVCTLYNSIGSNKSLFFIDKDYDEIIEMHALFTTNHYNFESHIIELSNVCKLLRNKHQFLNKSLEIITDFYQNKQVLEILHADFLRVKSYESLNYSVTDFNLNSDFKTLKITNTSLQKRVDSLSNRDFLDILDYNGKYLYLILSKLLSHRDFKRNEPNLNSSITSKDRLFASLIIELDKPKYIIDAISTL